MATLRSTTCRWRSWQSWKQNLFLQKNTPKPSYISSAKNGKHQELVWQVWRQPLIIYLFKKIYIFVQFYISKTTLISSLLKQSVNQVVWQVWRQSLIICLLWKITLKNTFSFNFTFLKQLWYSPVVWIRWSGRLTTTTVTSTSTQSLGTVASPTGPSSRWRISKLGFGVAMYPLVLTLCYIVQSLVEAILLRQQYVHLRQAV